MQESALGLEDKEEGKPGPEELTVWRETMRERIQEHWTEAQFDAGPALVHSVPSCDSEKVGWFLHPWPPGQVFFLSKQSEQLCIMTTGDMCYMSAALTKLWLLCSGWKDKWNLQSEWHLSYILCDASI